MEEEDEMVQANFKIPRGARDYLLQLAIEHNAYTIRKKVKHPSIQVLLRLMAAGVVKTVKGYEILEINNQPTYPYSRGKAKKKVSKAKG